MASLIDDDEIALPLVRRASPKSSRSRAPVSQRVAAVRAVDVVETEEDSEIVPLRGRAAEVHDRMTPGMAGGLMGFLAGAAAFGVVHAMETPRMEQAFASAATQWGIAKDASTAVAYLTAAAACALVGASFAAVTRHLRRFFPLVIWSLVFFVSLTLLVLAIARTYSQAAATMAPAILAASAVFAFVWAFELPLRKREPR